MVHVDVIEAGVALEGQSQLRACSINLVHFPTPFYGLKCVKLTPQAPVPMQAYRIQMKLEAVLR